MQNKPEIPASDMIRKSNICIVTYYDASFAQMGDLAWESMRRYAEAAGYDCRRFREKQSDRPHSWEKIPLMQQAFDNGYEFVFCIDADAMVVDLSKDILAEIERIEYGAGGQRDFFVARHDINGKKSPNLGIIVARNSEFTKRLLSEMWSMEKYANHPWWEQAAFMEYFGLIDTLSEDEKRLFDGYVRGQQRAEAGSHIGWLDEAWNFIPHISARGTAASQSAPSAPIIKHYAGLTKFRRLVGMIGDALRLRYLTPRDGLRYWKYIALLCAAKARTMASDLWIAANSALSKRSTIR